MEAFGDEIIPVMRDPAIAVAEAETVVWEESPDQPGGGIAHWYNGVLRSFWGPRIILLSISAIYGTNFALGSLMNDSLPPSAATASRMALATMALAPFAFQIAPSLRWRAIGCGSCTALGYVTQSLALADADPARVSFLGAATVLWIPLLELFVDKRKMGWNDAPQTWLAAMMCLLGVGILELWNPGSSGYGLGSVVSFNSIGGDLLALLQAVGFGTGCFLSAKMVREQPDQVLPVTAILIATTAFWALIWSIAAGWIGTPGWESMTLPGLFLDPALRPVAFAVLWTGIISTSFNFVVEISALGHVPASEASVLLASEPIWAALFAAIILGEGMGLNDWIGGAFIVAACIVNAIVKPSDVQKLFSTSKN